MLNKIDIIECLKDAQRTAVNKWFHLYERYLRAKGGTKEGLLKEALNARDQAHLLSGILNNCGIAPYPNDSDLAAKDKPNAIVTYGKFKEDQDNAK